MARTRNSFRIRLQAMALALTLTLLLPTPPLQAQEQGIAARVNGVPITVFRLERYFEDYLREQGRNLATLRSPAAYKRLKRDALERLIVRELLVQEARQRGIAVTDDELATARDRVVAGYKTREAFHRRMREAGFTEATFDDYLRQDLMAERALAALTALTTGSEPDAATVQQFYDENRARFVMPEQVRARHILIRVADGAAQEEREQARQRASALAARIAAGDDFVALARHHSGDEASRDQGGDLGLFPRGRMLPAFEAVAFELAPGELGGPVETRYGWHLIRVEARLAAQAMPEAEALTLIRRQLAAQRRVMAERQALQALRDRASVEVQVSL